MTVMEVTQAEADLLLAMRKFATNNDIIELPDHGVRQIPLTSEDRRQQFTLDIRRAGLGLIKGTYQNRTRHIVVLARLDIGGAPHRNPDGKVISCPHLHLYREGFGDKWAIPIPNLFTRPNDMWQSLYDFMDFIKVVQKPNFQRGLFT